MGRGGGKGGGGRGGSASRIVGGATFGNPQTLEGQKVVNVFAAREWKTTSETSTSETVVLEIRKRGNDWEVWIPRTYTGSLTSGPLPAVPISSGRPLRDAKALASRLIRDAKTVDRLQSLRYATKKPRWLKPV